MAGTSANETVVDIRRAGDLPMLYASALVAADAPGGGHLRVRLPEGRLEGSGAPAAVQLGASTGAVGALDVTLAGPAPDRPAVLDGISLQFVGQRLALENVVLFGSPRTAINATVTEELVLRGAVIAGTRIADATQETVLTVSIAPGSEGSVLLEDSWLVDNGGPRLVMGLLARSGSGAGATVRLLRSGLVANTVVHDLLIDGTRRVELDHAVLVGREEETARGLLLSAGTELRVRDSLVAPGRGRAFLDPESRSVSLTVERSTAAADEEELARLVEQGFEPASPKTLEAVAAAASLAAAGATSAPAVRAKLGL